MPWGSHQATASRGARRSAKAPVREHEFQTVSETVATLGDIVFVHQVAYGFEVGGGGGEVTKK